MTQPKFKHPDLIPARKVTFKPDPSVYSDNRKHKNPGTQSLARSVERDQLEEWIEKFIDTVEAHPDYTIKAHVPSPAPAKTIREIEPPKRFMVGSVRDVPQDPTVCVVRISKTTGVVCFYSEASVLEPLSEELPLFEACKLAKQFEDES